MERQKLHQADQRRAKVVKKREPGEHKPGHPWRRANQLRSKSKVK